MKKAFVLSCLLIWLCVPLSGCWNRTELNELSITSATSMDIEGDDWIVSYQVIIPSAISSGTGITGSGSSQSPITVFSTRGRTIRDAVNQSTTETPRQLFFAHNNILILSEEVARRGVSQILDLHYRNPDARETVSMLITKGKARTILEQLSHVEKIPGQSMRQIIFNETRNSSMVPGVMMYELALSLTSDAKSGVIPEILLSGGLGETSMESLKKTTYNSKIRLGDLAVMKEDKLAGWITQEQGLGVSFLRDKVKSTILSFNCKPMDHQSYNSSFRLLSSSTKLRPTKENGHFIMDIDIKGDGHLLESDCNLDLSDPEVVHQLEMQLQKEVTLMIKTSWQAVRKLRVDILGFADIIHRTYPKEWKTLKDRWESEFVQIELKPHVKISIDRVGLSNKSFRNLNKDDKD
ncbi:Ger(x)C family spore germination protein [Paenibacillus sp. UNC451MF]|uniref:Ger(x)C family spore germination protein n=1 Tax=Paenibacillus sp. UNC451MF TaxID=1449063 RepID=UPI000490209E|nr:Ger(x)C family spore germination protein [Paenibacillus sp. UNC451MF]